jgi:EAL domain-containing protein (putative c-di-GMP-specific phosphodiesterase class I)
VDRIKIDRTFVGDVPKDEEQCAIISAIVALAHALEIQIIAEGVDTEEQRHYLRRCGCDFFQGTRTGAPMDADTAAKDYL